MKDRHFIFIRGFLVRKNEEKQCKHNHPEILKSCRIRAADSNKEKNK